METVSLMLSDDHPLIRLGFRGKIRFDEDLEVQVLCGAGEPVRTRLLPSRKRSALELIADGCDARELSERLGLCLERAEALHEELVVRFGIDRIGRQVRSAIRSAPARRPEPASKDWIRIREELFESTRTREPRGQVMADQDLVRTLFPDAVARCLGDGDWAIAPDAGDAHRLGEGRTEAEAWTCAAIRLCEDEWFRPILRQLLELRSERRPEG